MIAVDLHPDDDEVPEVCNSKLAFNVSPDDIVPTIPIPNMPNITITIDKFEKKGEGINAYIVYKIVTKVGILYFI